MPQSCTICEHERRREIDAALRKGEPGRGLARRYGLAEASVRRHRANHMERSSAGETGRDGEEPMEQTTTTASRELKTRREAAEQLLRTAREEEAAHQERWRGLAVPAAAGEQGAREELSGIERGISEARSRAALASAALEEIGEREKELAAAEERRREAERLEAAAAEYDRLAEERARTEGRAQESLDALAARLGELSEIDRQQRAAGLEAGLSFGNAPLRLTIRNWLSTHLHAANLLTDGPLERRFLKPLPELSPLPGRAMRAAEIREAQERNAAEIAQGREAEARRSAEREAWEAYKRRRAELMAPVSSAPSFQQLQHERDVVLPALRKEFPWLVGEAVTDAG